MDEIKTALRQFRAKAVGYKKYADYYEGDHRLTFASEKFRNAFGTLFAAFADNLCPAVVDATADRLALIGFGVEEGAEETADAAWGIWQANRMDRRSGEVHLEALRSGDAYVVVWPDKDGSPTLYPNDGTVMTVRYDPETPGLIEWAAKLWRIDDGRLRLNLYFPDRIEKYVTRSKASGIPNSASRFALYEVEGEAWPVANPWGQVPVFHFANNASIGAFGRSELKDVVKLQDALNKAVADMLVAMEFVSFPQRWATGVQVDLDEETGKPNVPFTPGVERVWAVGNELAKFGQFDAANLQQFLAVQDGFRAEIARVSGTPMHYLMLGSGDFPSGEAMKTAEARFLAKVKDRQAAFGNVYEDMMRFALQIANGPDAQLSALWEDPTPRSDRETAETGLMKQQLGVSQQQILRELGYSPEQIEQMEQERQVSSGALGEEMLKAFEQGEE